MFKCLKIKKQISKKGSFTIEYVTFIVVIILALLAMQLYLRGAMSGRLRMSGDTFGLGRQYEPGVTIVTENP